MSSDDAFSNTRPKIDKFAALAATQLKQQDPTNAETDNSVEAFSETVNKSSTNDDEYDKNLPLLTETVSHPEIPPVPQRPPRRDKFASMAAAATPASSEIGGDMPPVRRPVVDKFAAVQLQKQIDDLKQIRESNIELSKQRDGILADCETAEDLIVTLLRIVEQTSCMWSDNARWYIEAPSIKSCRGELDKLSDGFQETLVELYGNLSKHATHVKAYKNDEADKIDTNSIYIQRVEQRLAETKLRLMQYCVTVSKGDSTLPIPIPETSALGDDLGA